MVFFTTSKNNMQNKRVRTSNLELLRIIMMLSIIAGHYVAQSGVLISTSSDVIFYECFSYFVRIACNVFVMIGVYFLCSSQFKIKRVFELWLCVLFYNIVITIICQIIGLDVTINNWKLNTLIINGGQLWFVSVYLILLLFSPILKILCDNLTENLFKVVLFLFIIIKIMYTTILITPSIMSDEIWTFIFIYILFSYLKKYKSQIFSRKYYHLIGFSIGFFMAIIIAICENTGYFTNILNYLLYWKSSLTTLPNLLIAFLLFVGFKNIKMPNSKIINMISSTTIGIYCIHQSPCFYMYMWNGLFNIKEISTSGIFGWLYSIVTVLSVFIICSTIEFFRKKFFVFLIENRVYYINICKKIDDYVN